MYRSLGECTKAIAQMVPHSSSFKQNEPQYTISLLERLSNYWQSATLFLELIENFPPLTRKVVIHILFAVRTSIAKEWHSKSPPNIEEVLSTVNAQYTMEKWLAYTEQRAPAFHKHWGVWRASKYASSHLWYLTSLYVCYTNQLVVKPTFRYGQL